MVNLATIEPELLPTAEAIDAELARRSLLDFTTFTHPAYRPNWHHVLICQSLDRFVRRETKNLMICMPSQNGKSELVSRRLPAYLLGHDPDLRLIACSYSADLASAMNRDVQRIMESPRYVMIFPKTRIPADNARTLTGRPLRNSELFEIVGRRGYYKCAGVGGSITGRSADVAIIDDPIKNRAEAESKAHRDRVWEWYSSTLRQRLVSDEGRLLLTMTRWHEDDLAARLIDAAKNLDADQWEIISLPAIAEGALHPDDPRQPGVPLWVEQYPLPELAKRRILSGSYEWSAMYQQRPSPAEGGLIKRHWWRFYTTMPLRFDEVLQSWDMAFKGLADSDYVVGQVWGLVGADRYLLDQIRDRLTFTQTIQAVKALSEKWPQAWAKYVEDTANGPAVIDTLSREVPGLIAVKPDGSKIARLHAVSPLIEAGNIWLPHPDLAPWVQDFVEECAAFPNAANDDQVDSMTIGLRRLSPMSDLGITLGAVNVPEREPRYQHLPELHMGRSLTECVALLDCQQCRERLAEVH